MSFYCVGHADALFAGAKLRLFIETIISQSKKVEKSFIRCMS